MKPLLACMPVCLTFVSITLIGLVVVVFGLSNRAPIESEPEAAPAEDATPGVTGRPPWWLLPLMVAVLVVGLLLLSLVVEN